MNLTKSGLLPHVFCIFGLWDDLTQGFICGSYGACVESVLLQRDFTFVSARVTSNQGPSFIWITLLLQFCICWDLFSFRIKTKDPKEPLKSSMAWLLPTSWASNPTLSTTFSTLAPVSASGMDQAVSHHKASLNGVPSTEGLHLSPFILVNFYSSNIVVE